MCEINSEVTRIKGDSYLDKSVVKEVLSVRVLQILAPDNVRSLAAPARDLGLDVDVPRRSDRHVHIAIVPNAPRSARDGEIVRIVLGDLSGGRLARRVRDDLEAARDEPVLVDRVV